MSEIKPVVWMSDQSIPYKTESDARQNSWNNSHPLYDQSAIDLLVENIDRLTAERDAFEKKWKLAGDEANDYGNQRDVAIKERDDALDALDANWMTHQRVVKAEAERDAAVAERDNMRSAIAALMVMSPYGK